MTATHQILIKSDIKHLGFSDFSDFFHKAATFASKHRHLFISPGTNAPPLNGGFRKLIAWSNGDETNDLNLIDEKDTTTWYFGFVGYAFKDKLHQLSSNFNDKLSFPSHLFFSAEYVIECTPQYVEIKCTAEHITHLIENIKTCEPTPSSLSHNGISTNITKSDYLRKIDQIKELIRSGEVYELNFCINHEISLPKGDGVQCFLKLTSSFDFPFAAYFKSGTYEIISASPERFLKKEKSKIISQPIKGTAPRGTLPEDDTIQKEILLNSIKDRAENMMIVDLVRNDLARICTTGTVTVDELFGIYSYPTVHQMISTVSGHLQSDINFLKLLQALFPMGSMTGAPKRNVMMYVDRLENFNRGAYSGTMGYITPDGDFDFNVLIRTLIINNEIGMGNYGVGSAITIDSNPDEEWQECMLKSKMLFNFFE